MRTRVMMVLLVAGVWSPAGAQTLPDVKCRSWPLKQDVTLTTIDQRSLRGTLQCLNDEGVLLRTPRGDVWEPLSSVRRVARPRDSVRNGMLMGAVVGLLGGADCECSSPPLGALGGASFGAPLALSSIRDMAVPRS